MKGIDLFCASQASTAICASMDQRSMVRQSSISRSRGIDRYNPHLRDRRSSSSRSGRGLIGPCNYSQSSSTTTKPKAYQNEKRRHSSAHPSDLISPTASSRYLLSGNTTTTVFFDVLSDFDHKVSALVPIEPTMKPRRVNYSTTTESPDEQHLLIKPPSSTRPCNNQVVVLKVSLHCKGCEGKVRKHISKMEGVTSFSIDFAMKKVTIIGDVTPLGVLASVSRVKNAQFWPSSTAPSHGPVGSTY